MVPPTGCPWASQAGGFKGRHQLDRVEGKTTATGMRWCTDHLEWTGLVVPALLDPRDLVVVHGLSGPVKYVRLVRRKLTAAPPLLCPAGL